jgi:hypothetical protein
LQQEADLQVKVRQLLGDEAYEKTRITTINCSAISRPSSSPMLQGDKEAKDAAAKQFFEILQEENQKASAQAGLSADTQMVPTLNFRNFASEQEAEKNLQLLDSIYEQAQASSGIPFAAGDPEVR